MKRRLEAWILGGKAVLCILLVLSMQLWTGACGPGDTSATGLGLGTIRIELSADHPLAQALRGSHFERPEAFEFNPSGRFRVIYPDDDRVIDGDFAKSANGLFVSRLALELGPSSAARAKEAGASRTSAQSVTLTISEARQVMSVVAGDGSAWVRPAPWVSPTSRHAEDATIQDFLDANANLMVLAAGNGTVSTTPGASGSGTDQSGGANQPAGTGPADGQPVPDLKATQSAFIPVIGVFAVLMAVANFAITLQATLMTVFVITVAITGILQPQAAWAMTMGANAQRSWQSPFWGTKQPAHLWTLETAWSMSGAAINANAMPELVENSYGTEMAGRLRAISPMDGSDLWVFTLNGAMLGPPTINREGTTYLTSTTDVYVPPYHEAIGDGAASSSSIAVATRLHAIASDGSEQWSIAVDGLAIGDLALGPNGAIYLLVNQPSDTGNHSRLYAFGPDGEQKWAFDFVESLTAGYPAIGHDGTIYLVNSVAVSGDQTAQMKLYAIGSDGQELWTATSEGIPGLCSVGRNGTVFVPFITASQQAGVRAFRPDGTEEWTWTSAAASVSGVLPTAALGLDDTVYVPLIAAPDPQDLASYQTNLYALDPANGSEKWVHQAVGMAAFFVSVDGAGTVYFVAGEVTGGLYAIDNYRNAKLFALSPDGNQKWEYGLPAAPAETTSGMWVIPAIGPGRLYIAGFLTAGATMMSTIRAIGEQ